MTAGGSRTMHAWVVNQPGPIETSPLRYVEKPVPAPAPGELLIPVLACAVCRSDLHVSEGDLPVHREHVTPGHMVVGLITALGEDVTDISQLYGFEIQQADGLSPITQLGASIDASMPSSSSSSRRSASSGDSPVSILPPGNSHLSPIGDPALRWQIST